MSDKRQTPDEIELLFEIYAPTVTLLTIDKSKLVILSKSGEIKGERISGKIIAPSAERVCRMADGNFRLDSRLIVQTPDEALISINFNVLSNGNPADFGLVENGGLIRAKVVFPIGDVHLETSDRRYQWINRRRAIGKISALKIGAGGLMKGAIYAVGQFGR